MRKLLALFAGLALAGAALADVTGLVTPPGGSGAVFNTTPVFNAGISINATNVNAETTVGSITSGTTGFGRNITGTVNDASIVDGIVDFANVTCTSCAVGSLMTDWQVGGSSMFSVDTLGNVITSGALTTGGAFTSGIGIKLAATGTFQFTSRGLMTSPAAGTIQLGTTNGISPVNQTLRAQGNTTASTNGLGGNLAIQSGAGTGNSVGSTIALQTPHAGSTGTVIQTLNTQILLADNAVSLPQLTSCSSGIISAVSTGLLSCLASSKDLKNDMGAVNPADAEDFIARADPRRFTWKNSEQYGAGDKYGLFAQDVCKINDRLCERNDKGEIQSYDTRGALALTIADLKLWQAAVSRQQHEIDSLKLAAGVLALWCIGLSFLTFRRRHDY